MYHNGGFPPIFEGGKKEVIQREFSADNVLSISQILGNQSNVSNLIVRRTEPIVFNVVDKLPNMGKRKKNKKITIIFNV